jgi:predicted transcriptional regulator
MYLNYSLEGVIVEDLSVNAKKVYDSLKRVGAVSEDKLKTADDLMKASNLGKALVNASIQELLSKGYVKRIARQKSAGYYTIK